MRCRTFLAAAVASVLFFACGIDEYAYLEPVASVTISSSDSQSVTVKLPTDQTDYFDEYLIYYRIYSTDDLSDENTKIASNQSSISTANSDAPSTLETVLKNLGFLALSFGAAEDDTEDDDFSAVANPLSESADSGINGSDFTIDFNLSSLGKNYPILEKEDGSRYRLLRNESIDYDSPEDQNLSFHDSFSTSDGDFYGDASDDYAHVLLYIVASGHDSSFSQLHSTATEIGVFDLTTVDSLN